MAQSGGRRWWALAALSLVGVIVGLDLTVLNLALPTLALALHASTGQLQWFIDAYSLVLAAALLPAGLLGDRYGRKRVLILALAVFGAGSLVCAYAPSPGVLVAARALLGLGAAFLIPLSLSVLPVLFTDAERPRAIAVVMVGTMLAYPLGPILGGWLLTRYWWGSVFLINVPVVVLALFAVGLLMPESRGEERRSLDGGGILASSAGLVALIYGAIRVGSRGWGDAGTLLALAAGIALLSGFTLWERRMRQPLVDLDLFRSRGFTWGTILTAVVSFAMFGILFALPQYFQEVRGVDALGSGVRMLPLIAGLLIGAPTADRLAARAGVRGAVALGFGILAVALGLGATTDMASGGAFGAAWLAVGGLGLGFAMPTAMDAALGALSAERSGVGSALIQAVRQAAASIGVAILGSVLNSAYRGRLHAAGVPAAAAGAVRESVSAGVAVARRLGSAALLQTVRSAFVHGMDVMLWICGGLAAAGVVLALAFLPRSARDVAEKDPVRSESGHEVIV